MHKVKLALYNAQTVDVENNTIRKLTQKIAGVSFSNGSVENFYSKQQQTKIVTPYAKDKDNKVLWRDDEWGELIEEYIVISSKEPLTVVIEERFFKIENGENQEENSKIKEIQSKSDEEEQGWNILYLKDKNYIVEESKIDKPIFKVIEGGKKKINL